MKTELYNDNFQNFKRYNIPKAQQEKLSEDALTELVPFNWVIIGAETGNRKNKVIPKREYNDID